MTHFVVGYPTLEDSATAARAMADGGAAYLEAQFPFSDPSADGPTIQEACREALDRGFRVSDGFEVVRRLSETVAVPIFIMSYANLVVAPGVDAFVRRARAAGAAGLIVPDLMPGSDEGLYDASDRAGLHAVPVVAPGVSDARMTRILAQAPSYLYAAIRVGITGSVTRLDGRVVEFLERMSGTGANVLAGFGIRTRAQVVSLERHVHGLVVGSVLVRAVAKAGTGGSLYDEVRRTVGDLVGS
jgi:tryptophan synthase alpha chain